MVNNVPHKSNLTAQQQALLYYNRKRQKARAETTSGNGNGLRGQNHTTGVQMTVRLTLSE